MTTILNGVEIDYSVQLEKPRELELETKYDKTGTFSYEDWVQVVTYPQVPNPWAES